VNPPSRNIVIRIFRILAVAEAFSWAALLTGMYLKWIAKSSEVGVEIAGPVHGGLFIAYGVSALFLWRMQRWPFFVALFAAFSAVLPFTTVLFEQWASRRGYLAPAARAAAGGSRLREPAAEDTADV
jgi:integral membrane protein